MKRESCLDFKIQSLILYLNDKIYISYCPFQARINIYHTKRREKESVSNLRYCVHLE